ncbi:MAG: flagellin-like protein [Candidatus Nanohaloarchaea archaeon]|jgi:flagellin-like protein
MGYRKGISPLIAAVLLIAFTMAVAGMFSQWVPGLIQSTQEDVSDSSDTVLDAASARVEIMQSRYNRGSGNLSVTFRNAGSQSLSNFTVTAVGDKPVQKQVNRELSRGEIVTVDLNTSEAPNQVSVSHRELPVTDKTSSISSSSTGGDKSEEDGTETDSFEPFVMIVNTSKTGVTNSSSFELSTGNKSFTYDFNISANGSVTNSEDSLHGVNGDKVIHWEEGGVRKVRIEGDLPHLKYDFASDSSKIVDVSQWGDVQWQSMRMMFRGAENLIEFTAEDDPSMSQVKSMKSMFDYARKFNDEIGSWDTSNVENMFKVFYRANRFNSDLGGWDTSSTTTMGDMFYNAESFEGEGVGSWDTGKVTDMSSMFTNAHHFNGSIEGWDTSNVENMASMFVDAYDFNQDIGSWNTSNVENMDWMFLDASSFDQNLSRWCVEQFDSEPRDFDAGADFYGDSSKMPDWGEKC